MKNFYDDDNCRVCGFGDESTLCESCAADGETVPATTQSTNPRYSGYDLCESCATSFNQDWERP